MRPFPLTVMKGGINRLRVKGAAAANMLYDLQNAYVTNAGTVVPREGTIRVATLNSSTAGLAAMNGVFNIFSSAYSSASLPAGYVLNVLQDPTNTTATITKILFAKPFMGFPFVVASFSDGLTFHYWLQNSGTWASNTDYTSASIVLPPTPNGIAYQGVRRFPTEPLWTANTIVTLGQYVEPNTPTGFAYQAVGVNGATNGLLLHFDGVAGSTSFPDSSGNNIVTTAAGAAVIITTSSEFGGGSLGLDGSTAFVSVPIAAGGPIDLSIVPSFTIEMWVKPPAANATAQTLFAFGTAASPGLFFDIVNGHLNGRCFGTTIGNVGTLTTGAWNSVAYVMNSGTATIFLNGTSVGTQTSGAVMSSGPLTIGAYSSNGIVVDYVNGAIDEFRITKGMALYTANYTPATTAFSSALPAHTGSAEPVWPTVDGGIIQEFGNIDASSTDAGTTQAASAYTTGAALSATITNRYGNSATIANSGVPPSSSTLSTLTLASTKVTTWKAGTNYAPGATVIPTTNQGAYINAVPNGDFNSSMGGWTFTDPGGAAAWTYTTGASPLSIGIAPNVGGASIGIAGGTSMGSGGAMATMTSYSPVTPGQSVTATAYTNPNNSGANLTVWIQLNWYDANDNYLSATGNQQNEKTGMSSVQMSVTGIAPANAAHVRVAIGAGSGTTSRNTGYVANVSWNLAVPSAVSNFIYEAVQPTAGSSSSAEPVWPTTLGNTVIDGAVTWEAIGTSIITWQAIPMMRSGASAPTFPTTIGASVYDTSTYSNVNGQVIDTTMLWLAIDRHISDPKDPNTAAVVIGASHVFAGDNDIVDYSAAVNPIDWSSTNNAGYLPTGLNNYGDNPVKVLALYRGNLVAFNAGGYQLWQIDPDPANMAFLDAQPVGSIYSRAAQSVSNDLLFLAEVGVRNLGTIGATANMAIGDTGQPVDPLVLAQIQAGTYDPFSTYYPARGQYMLIWGPQMFVLTINGSNQKSWSRYIFPEAITDATLNAGFLYFRTASNKVWQFNAQAVGVDDANTVIATASNIAFNGVMQWPYLDAGALGIDKMMVGVDLVGEGNCSIQLGWDQTDKSSFCDQPTFSTSGSVTTAYYVAVDDTVPGQPLPIPINAPSYSLILTFTGSTASPNAWSWEAANLYLTDAGGGGALG